jgi:hypothetical protein
MLGRSKHARGRSKTTRKQRGARSVDLVIARYKEPLTWLDEYKDRGFRNIHIYNKSDKEIECPTFAKGSRTKCVLHNIPNVVSATIRICITSCTAMISWRM